MTLLELAKLVERPDVHHLLVGEYDGPYSLGVTEVDADGGRRPALWLLLPGEASRSVDHVRIGNEEVLVVVERGHDVVVPLTGT